MKRTMKVKYQMNLTSNWIALMLLALTSFSAMAQGIDEERMARDLKIAENILGTLSNQENRLLGRDNIESNYVPDYGVVFSIPLKTIYFKSSEKGSYVYSAGNARITIIDRDDDEVDGGSDKGFEFKMDTEDLIDTLQEDTREQMITFLADYADLIGQLKPSDRVVIQTKNRQDVFFYDTRGNSTLSGGLSAQVLKSEISAHKQGKLSREKFIEKILFTEGSEKVEKDIELFSTIFSRLYEPDLSSTYYLASRRIGYTSLKNMGVTFNMRFYSSSSDRGFHTIRTTGESGLSQAERDAKIDAMYPEFEKSFKENILDYGRTIKSMEPNESLIFKVKLTECNSCEMPGEIEVAVKMKTLRDYDKGALSRDKALNQITIKRQ